MKKLFLLLLLLPLLGRGLGGGLLSAQNVSVTNLLVTEGSPSTVTFDVSWTRPGTGTVWMDSAWVFVDYNNAGRMTRLPLLLSSGATLTETSAPGEGALKEVPDNTKGMWVSGYARTDGSFSATVQLLTAETNIAGACAYASGYPPVGAWLSDSKITFTGTPWYEITLTLPDGSTTVTVDAGDTFLLPCSYTMSSFTDKTGAPGIFNCIPATDIYNLMASAPAFCTGDAVTFSLSSTLPGRNYKLYKDGVVVDALTGTGNAETFTGAFAGAGTYTAWMEAEGIQCAAQMNGVRVISENPLPGNLSLTANPATICLGQYTTLTASADNGALYYRLDNGGWQSSTMFYNLSPTANTSYTLSVQTMASCTNTKTDAVAVTVNQPPAMPVITVSASTVCQGTDIVFEVDSPQSGETYTWSGTAGTASGAGSYIYTVSGNTTGTKSVRVTAGASSNGTTCSSNMSAQVSAIVATMPAVPSITRVTSSSTVCQGTNITYRVPTTSGVTYTWLGDEGTVSGTGNCTYTVNGATTGTKSVTVYASQLSSGMTCVSANATTMTAIVASMPEVPVITASASTLCQNTEDIVFEVASPQSGESYTWTGTAGTASGSGSYLYTVSGSSTGTKTKSVTARLASSGTTCVSANAATVTAVVATMPAVPGITRVTPSSAATVCQGANITYRVTSVASNVTYTWTGTPGTVSGTSNNTYTVSGAETGTKTVAVYASLASSGTTCVSATSASTSTIVATMPAAPVIIASASTVCQGTDIVFEIASPVSGETYTWTGTAGTASGSGSYLFTVSGSSTGTKTKSVTARLASSGTTCVSAAATAAAVVAALPANPAITRAISASTVCQGTDITYRVTTMASGASYTWTGTPGTVSGTRDGTYTVSGATTGTKSVTLTATLASSGTVCPANTSASISTVVATTPAVPVINTSASSVCPNTNVVFEVASPKSGETYTWTGTAGTASGSGSYLFTVSGSSTGTKSKSVTARLTSSGTTCISGSAATVSVAVVAAPARPTITRVTATPVCQGTDIVFTVTAPIEGMTYTWSGDAGTASGTGNGTYTVSSASTGTKSVTVVANLPVSETICQSTASAAASAVVAIMPAIPVVALASAATVCRDRNTVLAFQATGTAGSTYTWMGSEGSASGTGSYTLKLSGGTTTGPRSVAAYASLRSSGTTCVSGVSPTVTGYFSERGHYLGAYDPVCGCETWGRDWDELVNCNGICRTTCDILASCSLTAVSTNQYEGKTTYPNAVAICAAKGAGWRVPSRTEGVCLCKYNDELPGGWIEDEYFWTSEPWYYDPLYDPPDPNALYRYTTVQFGNLCTSGMGTEEKNDYYFKCVK
jgi:hypothetical protein